MKPYELANLRLRLGKSQADIARLLGVHVLTVTKWETGVHRVPRSAVLVLQRMDEDRRREREAAAAAPGTGGASSQTVAKRKRRA